MLYANLIAYELFPGIKIDAAISTYFNFTKDLIKSSEDLQALLQHRVIINILENVEEIASVFNDINTNGVHNITFFQNIREIIDEYAQVNLIWSFFLDDPWRYLHKVKSPFFVSQVCLIKVSCGSSRLG